MLPHTRPVTHSKKEKRTKKKIYIYIFIYIPLQDPENATIYKTHAFQKNILKLKFRKALKYFKIKIQKNINQKKKPYIYIYIYL